MNRQEAIAKAKKLGYKWVARDSDYIWYGFTGKPEMDHFNGLWFSINGGESHMLGVDEDRWEDTLTEVSGD